MRKDFVTVHFNTPELTLALVDSVKKFAPECHITVFDNSDKRPFPKTDGVTVIDNTKGQIIDFYAELAKYPRKIESGNNWGSAKHSMSIDRLFDIFPDGFVLADSDILLRRDISDLFDESMIYVGSESSGTRNKPIPRLYPFLCWINVPLCRKHGIRYFDGHRSWGLEPGELFRQYDTGASFLEDCRKSKEPSRRISLIGNYIEHFGAGSWKNNDWKQWLEANKNLYIMEEKQKKTAGRPKKEAMPAPDLKQDANITTAPSLAQEVPATAEAKAKKPKVGKNKVLVVIPYFAKEAQGRELEYAVAGWRKHFKEDYLIVIVGDHHPVCDTGDDIYFIDCPRVDAVAGEYRAHLDHVKKFRAVMKEFPDAPGFIYTCDDMYAVNDFDLIDVKVLKIREEEIQADPNSLNEWSQNNAKTKAVLRKEGLPMRNFVCHLPVYYECDKLKYIYEKYDCDHNSYVVEQLYFNTYYPTRIPLKLDIDYDNFLCGVRRSNPRVWYIKQAMGRKIWLQNSIEGWVPALENILKQHYGI